MHCVMMAVTGLLGFPARAQFDDKRNYKIFRKPITPSATKVQSGDNNKVQNEPKVGLKCLIA
jgi:hypothetical protein